MPNVIMDSREVTAVPDILEKLQFKVETEVKCMQYGDYYFPAQNIGVERKTTNDFLTSIRGRQDETKPHKRRLFEQLAGLCDAYEIPILLIERHEESAYDYSAVSANVMSILYNWKKVKVYMSDSRIETIDFLQRSALYSGPSHNYHMPLVVPKNLSNEQTRSMMTMCIKKIGPKAASIVWSRYRTFDDLCKASQEELKAQLKGVPNPTIEKLYSVLHLS